jgi:hypothetical protein
MSLKHFHLFFISVCLSLMVFIAHWARQQAASGADQWGAALAAILAMAAGVPYVVWFLRRYKTLS